MDGPWQVLGRLHFLLVTMKNLRGAGRFACAPRRCDTRAGAMPLDTTLVTGATGLVGNAIVRELLARGRSVRALVRSRERASSVIPAGCELVGGDVTDVRSLHAAMRGCDVIYHAAGLPE